MVSAPALVTRSVVEFTDKETALARAIADHDKAAVLALIDQHCELISFANLRRPSFFEKFADEAAKNPQRILSIRDLSVHDIGGVALVSFYLDEKEPSTTRHITWAVLDAWKSGPEGWKLKSRFIGMRGDPTILPPGYDLQDPEIRKGY